MLLSDIPAVYQVGWDDTVGMWKHAGPGHTPGVHELPAVHDGRTAAAKLVAAGLDGQLRSVPAGRVLAALESMQQIEGAKRGCFRWYLEEREVQDTNAAFFIGLLLIALRASFAGQLATEDLARVDRMLVRLRDWFDRELANPAPRYANKYLGDLVCAWLLGEQTHFVAPELPGRLLDAATYWLEEKWGWGEHMSDIYAHICLDELSMLLLLSKQLPPDIRFVYERLRDELLRIDDIYSGGPRVPAIRSYAFNAPPNSETYRQAIRPWTSESVPTTDSFRPLRGLAHRLGWHGLVPQPATPQHRIEVGCYRGSIARSVVDGPLRVGAMSRYPIMEGIDHHTWGLSWQSFPVAAWHASGVWCFLQWTATEAGRRRAHPAESKQQALLGNSLSLQLDPPPVGQTFSVQHRSAFVVVRRMPQTSDAWSELTDRVRLIWGRAEVDRLIVDNGHQLRLSFAEDNGKSRTLSIRFIDLCGGLVPRLVDEADGGVSWAVHHPLGEPPSMRIPLGVWVWSLGDDLTEAPTVEAVDDGWRLTWRQNDNEFVACVSPKADEPLRRV